MRVRVSEFQALIRELYLEKDRARGSERTFLWLMEEVGELSVAVRDKDPRAIEEEVADVIAWAVSVANLHGVDLEAALHRKYPAACARCGARPCRCAEPSRGA